MSESAPEAPVESPPQEPETPPESEPRTYDEAYVKSLRAEAAKHRTEARAAAAELEKVRTANLTEAEKAIEEARASARADTVKEFGRRLARTELNAAAVKRNADFDTAALDYVDLAQFIGDDGEPDTKAISAAVERLVPAPNGTPSFDGGARGNPPQGGDMNALLRQAAGRA